MIRFLLLFLPLSLAFAQQPDEFFEKKIRPVLVAKCQGCHNAKMKVAGLDLSSAEAFAHGGPSGPLVAASPAESRIVKVIGYEDQLKMPPTGKLSAEDIENITAWVKMGAPWPGGAKVKTEPAAPVSTTRTWSAEQKSFWAFQPVHAVEPPKVKDEKWIQNPIDRFILAKLEQQGMKPAPRADKRTLLRRATFDLTGLPPTEQEVREFLADNSPDAYARLIDRLLASPRYGERWGRHWLDVARYADSTGNDEDHRYPYAWRFRDYVINAFNRDLPFDQFVREQIAGDMLPAKGSPVNRDGIVATGFLSLGAKALAQQDKQKMLYDIYDEQVDVTSRAFLGLTMACARCHDHKFDPIATKDYYAMTGIFAGTKDFANVGKAGVSTLLYKPLSEESEYRTYQAYQRTLAAKQRQINDVYDVFVEKRIDTLAPKIADYMVAARSVYVDHQPAEAVAAKENLDVRVLRRWVKFLEDGPAGRPHLEAWANADAAHAKAVALEYQTKYLARLTEYDQKVAKWRAAVEKADQERKPAPAKPAIVSAEIDPFFNDVTTRGPFAVSDTRRKSDDVMNLDKDVERQKKLAEQRRRERDMTIMRDELLTPEARIRVKDLRDEYAEMKKAAPAEPEMADAVEEGSPVEQHVFIRGDYNSPGEIAPKLFASIIAKPDDPKITSGSGRRELAEWLTKPGHPLTARVFVNRMWFWHFGDGIVRTPDNFGRMGERPTHPELLDYLAATFVKDGWSIKKMQRMMMLSNTYQMGSINDAAAEKDQENRLFSRFERRRLDVEEIRDGLLAIDGSLDLEMGGTLQTGFGTDGENSSGRLSLNPEKLTRRTVYIPLRRANLPTLMNLFDFGDATTVTGKRALTTVAPQALFAMNSEFVTERARNLSQSMLEHLELSDAERLDKIYLRTLNRTASAAERDSALSYIRSYQQKFSKSETEAWQSLCRVLMASNEFIYVD